MQQILSMPSDTGEKMVEIRWRESPRRPGDRMDARMRWQHWFRGEKLDRVPDYELRYWPETLARWHGEGLPPSVQTDEEAEEFFGFDTRWLAPACVGILPPFPAAVLSEDERVKITIDYRGVSKYQTLKNGNSTIPHYLEFPVRDGASWRRFKERLDPAMPGRLPEGEAWETLQRGWIDRDAPLGLHLGSTFGWVRNWMGFEGAAMACLTAPDLVHEIIETSCELVCGVIEPLLEYIEFDFGFFWEDMAFKNGPMISPELFGVFQAPRYRRITDLCRRHGIECFIVDCDGDMSQLVRPWLACGVNTMFPLEIAAGADPVCLREAFPPERLALCGGVDKRALAGGRESIKKELRRLAPVVRIGRYLPHVDHKVPPDVAFRDYIYYLEAKRDILETG